MNRVETISTCGRCGAQEVRAGTFSDPPVKWAQNTLTRCPGSGWEFRTNLYNDMLCPPCQEVVLEALKPKGAAPKQTAPPNHGTYGCICAYGEPCDPVCPVVDCFHAEIPDAD